MIAIDCDASQLRADMAMTVYALLCESAELCFAFVYSTVCLSWIDSKPESNVAKSSLNA